MYWYLQESYREGGVVKTRHIQYIGKQKPDIPAEEFYTPVKTKPIPKKVKPSKAREAHIYQAYTQVRKEEPTFTGLIPIGYIKKKLDTSHPELSESQINETLLDLEKRRKVDLQIAYDPTKAKGKEYGIPSDRGLKLYVRYRNTPEPVIKDRSQEFMRMTEPELRAELRLYGDPDLLKREAPALLKSDDRKSKSLKSLRGRIMTNYKENKALFKLGS